MKAQKFIPLLVVAAGLLAYHNSFTGPFIFDDEPSIQKNPTIRHLWPIWQALSPSATAMVGGRPVINFSLALNYAFGGTSVQGYHALNLAIHILAALTLFGVVRRTLLQPALRERFGTVANGLALATAVIWTVHPLQTEAVTYVSQRAESLMGLFYLLTLYCFIRGIESQRPGLWFTFSIVVCLLGMATKEVMVTAPLMVLLYDWTFVAGSFRAAWTQRRRLYVGLGGTWLLLGYLMAGLQRRGVGYGLGITWHAYALTECQVVVNYLWLALWPDPLIFDYGMDIIIRHATEAMSSALILVLLAAGVVVGLKRRSALGFIGAWLLVILAPTSSVVPVATQPMAESRMYLPLAAVVAIAVVGAYMVASKRLERAPQKFGHVLRWTLAGSVVLMLAGLTVRRNLDYASEIGIWLDTVNKRPNNARAHYNLGLALELAGKVKDATRCWEQAVRIRPDYAKAHYNLGNALSRAGETKDAIRHYEQALRVIPSYSIAQNNLAWVLATRPSTEGGDPTRAVALAERASELTGHHEAAFLDTLAVAYAAAGRFNEAIATAEKAIELARSARQPQVIKEIKARLQLYRSGYPYRESIHVTSPPNP